MELTCVKDILKLNHGDMVNFDLAITGRTIRSMKSGNPYVIINLSDGKDNINLSIFNSNKTFDGCNILSGKGKVNVYNNTKQIISFQSEIEGVKEKIKNPRADAVAGNVKRLNALVNRIENEFLKGMVTDIVVNEPYMFEAPGAVRYHHNYLGGLLEHTVEVAEIAGNMASVLPNVSVDVTIAGALLHDIGKLDLYGFEDEFKFEPKYNQMEGMLEHITLGIIRLHEWQLSKEPNLTEEEKNMITIIKHIIVSHHGQLEYGSPVTPKTLEASIVNKADSISALYQPLVESEVDEDGKFIVNYIALDSIGKAMSPRYVQELAIATMGRVKKEEKVEQEWTEEPPIDNNYMPSEYDGLEDSYEDSFPGDAYFDYSTTEYGV